MMNKIFLMLLISIPVVADIGPMSNSGGTIGPMDYIVPTGCDTLDTLTHGDTTATTVAVRVLLPCPTAPTSVLLRWGRVTTPTDSVTINTADSLQGDTVKYTISGLIYSDSVYYDFLVGSFATPKQLAYTADSVGGGPIEFCAAPRLDSVINIADQLHDSGQVGNGVVIYGSDFKSDGMTIFYKGTEWVIDYKSDTMCTAFVTGSLGDESTDSIVFTDSCGNVAKRGFTLWAPSPPPTYTLTVNYTGTGSTDPTGSADYDSGVGISISTTPGIHYHFLRWDTTGTVGVADLASATTTCTLSVENATITALFGIDTFTLTEVPPTNGTITYSPNAGGSSPRYYPHGTRVTVTATADPGYVFRGWGGAISSTTPVDSFLMTDHLTISATFEALPTYLLSYDPGSGTGTPPAAPTEYDSTEIVTVLGNTGFTKEGYVFSSWNTMPDGSGTRYLPGNTFEMTALTTLFAQWSLPTTEGRRKKGFIWSYKEQYRGF